MRKCVPSAKIVQSLKRDDDGEHAFRVFLVVSLASLIVLTFIAGIVVTH
ncbi:MAG TPA: hypothetical protein PKD49_05505 [Hyphomicrobium sp.]|nr:hypothetical protein [Hyphomicrobium sp.]